MRISSPETRKLLGCPGPSNPTYGRRGSVLDALPPQPHTPKRANRNMSEKSVRFRLFRPLGNRWRTCTPTRARPTAISSDPNPRIRAGGALKAASLATPSVSSGHRGEGHGSYPAASMPTPKTLCKVGQHPPLRVGTEWNRTTNSQLPMLMLYQLSYMYADTVCRVSVITSSR